MWVLVLTFFVFLSAVSPRFSVVLSVHPRGRLGGLRRKVGSACEESEENVGGIEDKCF